jgi:molecular chaperone HscB
MTLPDDPFSRLGLPHRFDLDPADVQRAHLRLVAKLHPDRIADPVERAAAQNRTAALNEARDVLLNAERRANRLLVLLGGPAKEDDTSLPDGFLMEMMEIRQQIEEVIACGDAQQHAHWTQWARQQRDEYTARVAELFASITHESQPDGATLAAIREQLNAWRYIERLIEQLP